jgi:hypothetical protein
MAAMPSAAPGGAPRREQLVRIAAAGGPLAGRIGSGNHAGEGAERDWRPIASVQGRSSRRRAGRECGAPRRPVSAVSRVRASAMARSFSASGIPSKLGWKPTACESASAMPAWASSGSVWVTRGVPRSRPGQMQHRGRRRGGADHRHVEVRHDSPSTAAKPAMPMPARRGLAAAANPRREHQGQVWHTAARQHVAEPRAGDSSATGSTAAPSGRSGARRFRRRM